MSAEIVRTPTQGHMKIAVVLVRRQDVLHCYVAWCVDDIERLCMSGEPVGCIGYGYEMPEADARGPLELGGDYPQLFEALAKLARGKAVLYSWDQPSMCITLAPTRPDEACGMLGGRLKDGQHRLCLYFNRQSGRQVSAWFAADNLASAKALAEHAPLIEASPLPETSDISVIEFDPDSAHFLCWLFQLYLHQPGSQP